MENNKNPKVSIIVPCYNVEKYVFDCLNSLVNQTMKNIEIIVVNDGSKDKSIEIVEEFARADKRIKIINQKNQGLSMARNAGLKNARGEFISFVDSDDWIDFDFIEKLYNAAIENNCDIAASSIIRKRKFSEKYRVFYKNKKIAKTLKEKIEICKIPECCYVWNKIYKHEKIKNSLFKPDVYFEDVFWTPEILKNCESLIAVDGINYYYRANRNSIVKKCANPKKQQDSYEAKKYIIDFFEKNNLPLAEKNKTITKKIFYFLNIPILKIKEFENRKIYNFFGFIKITTRKNKLSKKKIKELNFLYENGEIENLPKIKSKYQTLDELINSSKSLARFGDGEFNLMMREDLPFQKYDEKLAKKLKEILLNESNEILTAIPDIFGSLDEYNKNAKDFWRKFVVNNREKIYSLIDFQKQYYAAEVSRPYMDLEDKSRVGVYFEAFKNVWKNKNVVFIEGNASRLGFNNDLFNGAKSIKRIIAPAQNAFRKYDEILDFAISFAKMQENHENLLFILALGPSATVLAYDLALSGFRALDLGHIDIEYEWFLKRAKRKIAIKDKYVNEAKNGRKITKIKDEKYKNEIIFDCSKEIS